MPNPTHPIQDLIPTPASSRADVDYYQQYAELAARTHRAVIAAMAEGTICPSGAAGVLAEWGLPPLPKPWSVAVTPQSPVEVPHHHPVGDCDADAVGRIRLELLRRAIRSRAITAVASGDLGRLRDPAARVDRFLIDIGLDPLPRAWLVCVNAATTLTLAAVGDDQARTTVWAAFAARTCHQRISVEDFFIDTYAQGLEDGRWQAGCGEILRVWVRATSEHAAADAATRLVRAHLDALALPQLHGHRLRITGAAQTIDPVLDPAHD
ncbi:hypothetical protein [Catellatospora citrea]|uniref:Uncharacterized protein n=1 Tax=Catellatospora citrea TaxID=53366 RepID=A0A8J3K8S6_9ACTN|nr:hypothetical protein [Catellatospora citrea]RKE10569.1 hypothetical protein C8E86_5481 [Catellatospora citrea]GIF98766.1 hypothetical protein Cci01nite_38600 [Catellatospora citrea]